MSRPRTRAGALSSERATDVLELVRAENAALRAELDLHREVVRRAADLCEAAAGGDLEARLIGIEARGDLGRLTSRLNHLLDATDAFTRESRAALEHASAGKFYRRVLLRGMPGSFRHASRAINAATARMAGQAQALADAASRRAALAGDFEFAIGTVVATLASAATELRATAESMTETAMETSGRASSVASAATETAASVNSAAVVAEQLSAAAGEIGRRAAESAVATSRAAMGAATAHDILHQFAAASTRIGRVVKMIAEVSSQTRLLALNATIEAARAGEAGRGFAVVASEVKSLAQQTASATEEVANEIGAVQSASSRAIGALDGILGSMAQLEEITATIAGAVEEQRAATTQMSANVRSAASGTEQVSRNIGEVTHGVANTSEAATQMLAAAAELSKQAEGLRGSVDAFLQHMRQG